MLIMKSSTIKNKASKGIKIILFISLISLTLLFISKRGENKEALKYITQEVKRGDLLVTVTATGNLQALNQVDVGVEVSGTIEKIYVDYNQHVKKGQVLAKLDLSKFEAQVKRAEARLRAAQADLIKAKADFKLAQLHMQRLRNAYKLSHGKVPSKIELDEAEAKLRAAEAKVCATKAEIYEAKADLKYYKTELSKAIIYSPIDGIVLARHVEEGQTVAASFQTPILFTLAEDLKRMELHVDVDEADIGQVKVGQYATFTVDAYPDRIFSAKVREVRFAPKIVEGVVTYETILDVDNSDLSLRPGMTATAKIIVKHIKNALLVPNKAFRFVFPKTYQEKEEKKGLISIIIPHPPRRLSTEEKQKVQRGKKRKIWILRNGHPVQVLVTVGATDGIMTQVISGDIQPGTKVILDVVKSK
ncbi:MAG: efflux RND transporter periplasmic adaptor subunit [Deltaproteobacteria bacterium]|nr:MAG: efflux RND transporter periplasmic adaptor subunit [Deltaproteobacteria bacterium]